MKTRAGTESDVRGRGGDRMKTGPVGKGMRVLSSLCLVAILFAGRAMATDYEEVARLVASDRAFGDLLGHSVSLFRDTALVGAVGDDGTKGSAYVFRFDGTSWAQEQKLTASDRGDVNEFGRSVSMGADVAVVGSPLVGGTGAAYVYRFDGTSWFEEQKLTASDAAGGDYFGFSVSVFGDALMVGAVADDGKGAAYLYRFDGTSWVEEQKLTASDGGAGASFGIVSMTSDAAIIGAYGGAGAAYIFGFDGTSWVEEHKLTASDGAGGDSFGTSVSLSGDAALIGAFGDDGQRGSAYVFRFDGTSWVEEQKLTSSEREGGDAYGFSVSLLGTLALVGAPEDDGDSGAGYLYRFDGANWSESQKLTGIGGQSAFGRSVALGPDTLLFGAQREDTFRGAMYVFGANCLEGTVNAGNGFLLNTLVINGSTGGDDRAIEVGENTGLAVTLMKPGDAGNGKFVLHGNLGEPSLGNAAVLPFDIGLSCFPFFLSHGASPVIVANNIGKVNLVGQTSFFGINQPNPDRATTTIQYPPQIPFGTVLTFQAIIVDPGSMSSRGASMTNAIVVSIVP